MHVRRSLALAVALLTHSPALVAQESSVPRLDALVNGLTVTPRVLLIGADPGDVDAGLIAWLSLGHHVQTATLSLTRGESQLNYSGAEAGATVGAVHVQEALNARAVDGGEQYFTHAFDFGGARTTAEAFRQWDHDKLLGDVVMVVRAFRPHVIVARFADDTTVHDGKRQVSAILAREVFDAALDTIRYSVKGFGMPWATSSVFGAGTSMTIDARVFDHMLGMTYADVAVRSRSQLRSAGFAMAPWEESGVVPLKRLVSRDPDHPAATSLFDGVDTTFARLATSAPADLAKLLATIAAHGDSVRTMFDLRQPMAVVPQLQRMSEVVYAARNLLHGCRHPSPRAALTIVTYRPCGPSLLDLDASLDLLVARTSEALLAAAGVSVTAVADREFIATGDTAHVAITVQNHGDFRVRVNDASVTGGIAVRMGQAIDVPAGGSVSIERQVMFLSDAHPWWMWKREENFFPNSSVALDGVARAYLVPRHFAIDDVALPEGMRTVSDAILTITVGTTTVSASTRPIVYRTADPILGVRDHAVSGVPPVTLTFERAIEWAQAGRPLKKDVRLIARSYSDRARTFSLASGKNDGAMRFDALPHAVTLESHAARELSINVRGTPQQVRYELGLSGVTPTEKFISGFRTAQYSYLAPLHFFRRSALYVQGAKTEIPARLSVAYVRGAGDDIDVALKQLGVPVYTLNAEGLLRFGLEGISTLVLGPEAFRVDPGLAGITNRFSEFLRKGGTIVMMSNPNALSLPGIIPYPLALASPYPEQVMMSNAPVSAIDVRSRLLNWPNRIDASDWNAWVADRATSIPSTVDPHYEHVLEMHDPDQPANRNVVLTTMVGKGRFIYTSITFGQQIANGVPGAMRLFINLLSAGLGVQ